MQASDASTYARRMLPVIWTNRYNSDGSVDATAQNTYGAPIVTVQRVGVTAKLADGSSVETSDFAFNHASHCALNAAPGEIPHLALHARRRGHGGKRCGSLPEAS